MIHDPETACRILQAISAILSANNGYADIGRSTVIADAVTTAGFVVITTSDLHGNQVYRGFTQAAQSALAVEPFGVSTYRRPSQRVESPDYEAAILARNDRHLFA